MDTSLTLAEAVSLYEDAPCGYVSLTLDGTILRSNRTLAGWLGAGTSEALRGQAFQDLLTPPSKLLYGTYYSSLLQMQGMVGDLALELSRNGKPPLAIMITSRIMPNAENRPTHISSTLFDITERRRYERELLVAKRKADILADVVRFSDTAILTASFDLEIETWNTAAHNLFGGSLTEASSLDDFLPEPCLKRFIHTKVVLTAMPPLLLKLWREQHPKGHEQVQLDFTSKKAPARAVPLFREGKESSG